MKAERPGTTFTLKEAAMLHIDLTLDERTLMEEMLDAYLTDLRGEISATHSHEYKEGLKQREVLLRKIIAAVHEAKEVEAA
jgi:hypothetical protein